jgi:hypothetical protein
MDLGPYEYIVVRIDGDYAALQKTDDASAEEKLVARALLPPETGEGTRLRYECLEYTVI